MSEVAPFLLWLWRSLLVSQSSQLWLLAGLVDSFIYMLGFRLLPLEALVQHIICWKWLEALSLGSTCWYRIRENQWMKAYRSECRMDLQILCVLQTLTSIIFTIPQTGRCHHLPLCIEPSLTILHKNQGQGKLIEWSRWSKYLSLWFSCTELFTKNN